MDFRTESVVGLAGDVRAGRVAARELVGQALERIEALNGDLNAFVKVDGDLAMERAASVDEAVAGGGEVGPLSGIPLAVKDLEDAVGFPTSHGSALWAGGPPAARSSVLVERLERAGAIVVGKTNTPELGYMADTVNPAFGRTVNPWNREHTPGGSSGGSAVAIASGMVPLATGSDGGGSIRIPAACCGFPGVKASLGRVPSGGRAAADWPDLSTRGPMARRLSDTVAVLDLVVGPEPTDLRSLPRPEASWTAALEGPRPPVSVAWSPTLGYGAVDAEVADLCAAAVAKLSGLGADVTEVASVFDEDPVGEWLAMSNLYNWRLLREFHGTPDWERLDPGLAAFVSTVVDAPATVLLDALDTCHRMNVALVDLFHEHRVLLTPTTAAGAPPWSLGGVGVINGEVDLNWVKFTYPFNMTRSPVATVPVGRTSTGVPVGIQVVGPQHGDLVVLRTAAALDAAIGFDELAPVG